jgi:hypothetical protein
MSISCLRIGKVECMCINAMIANEILSVGRMLKGCSAYQVHHTQQPKTSHKVWDFSHVNALPCESENKIQAHGIHPFLTSHNALRFRSSSVYWY